MAASKQQSSYQIIGLATASIFLMLFAYTMYKLDRAGATPYKTQVKNGYATMDDSYLDSPTTTHPLDALIAERRQASQKVNAQPKETKQRFEFYSVLPDFQVDVPMDSASVRAESSQTFSGTTADSAQLQFNDNTRVIQINANAKNSQPITDTRSGLYVQAGSFIAMSDARHRRAEVIMLGLNAKVESAQVQGQVYHRVKLGPYEDPEQRLQAQQRLTTAGIESIVKPQ